MWTFADDTVAGFEGTARSVLQQLTKAGGELKSALDHAEHSVSDKTAVLSNNRQVRERSGPNLRRRGAPVSATTTVTDLGADRAARARRAQKKSGERARAASTRTKKIARMRSTAQ
eukprot:2317143-Pyramimonas_sp.AAC.1